MARGSSTGIILILFMCMIFVIGGGLYVYTTRDQEGDTCTGDDPNAEYTLDQDLNCTFVQCYPGFGINEDGACVFIAEEKATTELELAREDLKLKQLAAQSAEITSEGEKSKAAAELVAAEDRQRAAALALEAAEAERIAAEIEREAELAAEAAFIESQEFIDMLYPVGTIYKTEMNENPGIELGGTWRLFAPGRCIIGVGKVIDDNGDNMTYREANMEGGELKVKLTESNMAPHSHPYRDEVRNRPGGGGDYAGVEGIGPRSGFDKRTNSAGGGTPHNNVPPYITAYLWERMA